MAGTERLDALEPLWTSLAAHHGELTPAELPVRPPAEGWPARRERYRAGLGEGAVLFLAERLEGSDGGKGPERHERVGRDERPGRDAGASLPGAVLGFAFARPRPAPETLAVDRLLDVETVAVLPAARGAGIGTALMEAIDAWARERGIDHLSVSVRTANEGARRLYERRGFRSLYETMYSTLERPDR